MFTASSEAASTCSSRSPSPNKMVPSPAPAETAPEMGHPSKDKASTGGEYTPITTRLRTPLGVSSARTPDSRTASTGRPGRGRGRGRGRRGRPARDDNDVSPQPVKTPPRSSCKYFIHWELYKNTFQTLILRKTLPLFLIYLQCMCAFEFNTESWYDFCQSSTHIICNEETWR